MAELSEYGGQPLDELARLSGAARVYAFEVVESTMDVAHDLARAGALHGTVAIAEAQRAGRGRERREWLSPQGGVWLTIILRALGHDDLQLLPLRVGIAAARSLEQIGGNRIGLKWPNDLFVGAGKLGGILVEARWRGEQLDWVAVGVGINTSAPESVNAAGLGDYVSRAEVAVRVIRAVLESASRGGELTREEMAEFTARDVLSGELISAPAEGIVRGISPAGELLVENAGALSRIRSGSIVSAVLTQSLSANR